MKTTRVRRWGVSLLAGATAVGGASAVWSGIAAAATSTKIGFTPVTSATQILPDTPGQTVADEVFTLPNTFKKGEKVTLDLAPATSEAATCAPTTGNWVTFTGTPTATVTGGSASETKPTFTVAPSTNLGSLSTCTGSEDQLTLTVGNTAAAGSTAWTVTVKGIKYSTMPATPAGNVAVSATASAAAGTTTTLAVTPAPTPNADVVYAKAARSAVPVPLQPSTDDQGVSDLTVTEPIAGTFQKTAVVTVTLSGATFDKSAGSKATASGGGAAVTKTAVTFSTGGTAASFKVKTASSTAPATYTLSNLALDTTTAVGKVVATVTATNPTGLAGRPMPIADGVLPLGAVVQTTRIAGGTPDATAVAEFEKAFPVTATSTTTGNRSAVVATDADYQDALSAAYLAHGHSTAVLLTPKTTLSTVTLEALAYEGVEHVYIVGGPLAVSDTIETTLKKTPSYKPGGTVKRGSSTTLTVTRIYGATADQTAEKVAEAFKATSIGSFSATGAYGGTYNDTSGRTNGTTKHQVPTTSLRTAILARDGGYQDATAASALAYHTGLPILLTPTTTFSQSAARAIQDLGIQQVIVMGGTYAITPKVVSAVEALGTIDVFRVAGSDATDTARELASFELASPAADGRQWTATTGVYLARGNGYTDAVAGSALAAKTEAPILLTENTTTIGTFDTAFFQKIGAGTFSKMPATADFKVEVLGGGLAVTTNALNEVKSAITTGATS